MNTVTSYGLAQLEKRIAHLLLALVLVCLPLGMWPLSAPHVAQAQTGNLLVNGSFELGTNPGSSFITLQPGSTAITGWTVTRASIDYIGGLWRASDGGRSLDLDGSPGVGGIAQRFATVPGRAYRVSFDLAGNPMGGPTVKVLGVQAAGQQGRATFDVTGKRYEAMGWTRYSWTFTATASTTTLEFYSLDTTNGNFGPALDNVVVTTTGAPPPPVGNLLVNGSFELGTNPGGSFITLQPGSTAITGWTVTRASIDYIGGLWRASDGTRSLDLDGTPGVGGITQRFATVPGRAYRVSFDLAGNPSGPPSVKVLGVRAAGQQARATFDVTGKRYEAMGWTRYSWTFTATAATTTLEFYSLDTTGGSFGPALDNVVVTEAVASPPPVGELLVNGSFELGTNPGGSYLTLQPGSTAITGWTVTRASIDYIGGWWRASNGTRSLDLDGTPGVGGIAQRFATVPGRAYRVSFDLAGNPSGPPSVKVLGVRAAGQQARFTFDVTGKRYEAMGWTRYSWTFTATAATTTLEFYSLDTSGGSTGPALDNVSVTAG